MKRLRWFFHLVVRSLTAQRWRMGLIFASLLVTVVLVTTLVQLSLGVKRELGSGLSLYGANLLVVPRGADLAMAFGGLSFGKVTVQDSFSEADLRAELQELGLQDDSCTVFVDTALLVRGRRVALIGMDLKAIKREAAFSHYRGGWPSATGEVLMGKALAQAFGLQPGADVQATVRGTPLTLRVSGVIEVGGPEDQALLASKAWVQKFLGATGQITRATLNVPPREEALSAIAERLASRVPALRVQVVRRIAHATERLLHKVSLLLGLITLAVLVATCISVMSTRGVIVLERHQEFGVMKAIGASRLTILKLLLAESLLVGLVAGVSGLFLGVGLSRIFSQQIFDVALGAYPHTVWIALLTGWTVAVLGSILPICKVLSRHPVALLQSEAI